MKQVAMAVGIVVVLGLGGVAEASQFSDGVRKTWGYLFSPVNCVADFGTKLTAATAEFVKCVLANANPGNLIP